MATTRSTTRREGHRRAGHRQGERDLEPGRQAGLGDRPLDADSPRSRPSSRRTRSSPTTARSGRAEHRLDQGRVSRSSSTTPGRARSQNATGPVPCPTVRGMSIPEPGETGPTSPCPAWSSGTAHGRTTSTPCRRSSDAPSSSPSTPRTPRPCARLSSAATRRSSTSSPTSGPVVWGVSPQALDSHEDFARGASLTFPLLSDNGGGDVARATASVRRASASAARSSSSMPTASSAGATSGSSACASRRPTPSASRSNDSSDRAGRTSVSEDRAPGVDTGRGGAYHGRTRSATDPPLRGTGSSGGTRRCVTPAPDVPGEALSTPPTPLRWPG